MGSYWLFNVAAVSRNRRICGSVWVAQRAKTYSTKKINTPPSKLLSRLNVPAPRHMAKKKSFRSAPRMVRGRDSERCTRLIRLAFTIVVPVNRFRVPVSGKEPGHEVDGGDGHAHAEEHS